MSTYVHALAEDPEQARALVAALQALGITSDQVSVLAHSGEASGDLAQELHAHAPRGAFSGGNIGASLGWLAGLTTLAIPGLGLLVAAGPIVGFLTGIAVGRAVGNLNGAMIEEMGIPDADVQRFREGLRQGRILISVKLTTEDVGHVMAEMRRTGAVEVGPQAV